MKKRRLKKSIKMPIILLELFTNLVIVASIDFNFLVKLLLVVFPIILLVDEN